MSELSTTMELVKTILIESEDARESDDILYCEVIERLDKINETCVAEYPLFMFLRKRASIAVPSFETVRRSRQKVQADFPALAGSEAARKARAKKQEEFRAFARGER